MDSRPANPAAAVRERVRKWRPVVLSGGHVKDSFAAGKAAVSVDIRPLAFGDGDAGFRALEARLVAAVNAAQSPKTEIVVAVRPAEKLGIAATAVVRGPA